MRKITAKPLTSYDPHFEWVSDVPVGRGEGRHRAFWGIDNLHRRRSEQSEYDLCVGRKRL